MILRVFAILTFVITPFYANAFEAENHIDLFQCERDLHNSPWLTPSWLSQCLEENIDVCRNAAVEAEARGEAYAYHEARLCDHVAFEQADRILNAFYRRVISEAQRIERYEANAYNTGLEELVRESQRAWLAVRDSTCELDVTFGAIGAGLESVIAGCKARMTMQRVGDFYYEVGDYLN